MIVLIYKEINLYIETLKANGYEEYANEIHDAFIGGAMASEILGRTLLALQKYPERLKSKDTFLVDKTNFLIKEVRKVLTQ